MTGIFKRDDGFTEFMPVDADVCQPAHENADAITRLNRKYHACRSERFTAEQELKLGQAHINGKLSVMLELMMHGDPTTVHRNGRRGNGDLPPHMRKSETEFSMNIHSTRIDSTKMALIFAGASFLGILGIIIDKLL